LENITARRKLVRVFPCRCNGIEVNRAVIPMITVKRTQKAAIFPASAPLIDEVTSWTKMRQGESTLKESVDNTFTLPLNRCSMRYPNPAITKIGTTSEIRIEKNDDTFTG
jgi:hypothetical protein